MGLQFKRADPIRPFLITRPLQKFERYETKNSDS